MEKTIKVTGRSTVSAAPDLTRICFDQNGWRESYEETVRLFADGLTSLQKKLKSCGFDEKDLKTVSYNLSVKNENYRDEQGNYRTKQIGYEFNHSSKIEFTSDDALLSRILSTLASDGTQPEFRVEYALKDPEAVKKRLIADAVRDASEKAEILSAAAGVKNAGVVSIVYSYGDDEPVVRPTARMKLCSNAADAVSVNVTPENIVLEDSVTVVFAIGE